MMKPGVIVLSLLGPWASVMAADPGKAPSLYLSELGQYRAAFPKEPATSTKRLATIAGPIPVHTAKLEIRRGLTGSVSVAEYPDNFRQADPRKVLDGIRDSMKAADGHLSADREIQLSTENWPGREIVIEAGGNAVRSRCYLVQNRLYLIQVSGSKEVASSDPATEFLDSFAIIRTK